MCAYVLICMCMEESLYTYGETKTQINDHQPAWKWEVHNWIKESGDTLHTEADRTWCPRVRLCAQLCPALSDPMDCSPPGSSAHGISQARILEWAAISSSRDLPDPGIEPGSLASAGDFFTIEPPGKTLLSTLRWKSKGHWNVKW